MSEIVNRQIVVGIVADDVQKTQESLLRKQQKLNEEIKRTSDPKSLADLERQLKSVEQQLDRNNRVLKGELLPTFNQLSAAARKYAAEFKKTGDPEVLKQYQAVSRQLAGMRAEMNSLERDSGKLTKSGIFSASFWANLAAGGIQAAASAFSGFFRGAIDEALAADQSTRRLEATLSNLGRSDAFDRIARKADEMAEKFRYLDNDDIVAVFNKLIDYGKLTEVQMNQLLPVIIDFAAKSRTSLDEATSVIVKALEGNGKAMKEYGISIKDTGNEADRLQLIMTTLREKVDGSADAFQNTAAGGIAVARQEFANLKEEVGNNLLPVLNKLLSVVNALVRPFKDLFGGGSIGGDSFIKDQLLQSPDVKRQANENLKQLENSLETFRKIARARGIEEKKITDEFLENARKRRDAIQAEIKQLSIRAVFSSGQERRERAIRLKDAGAELMALTQFIDQNTVSNEKLGISGGGSGGKDKPKDPKKAKEDAKERNQMMITYLWLLTDFNKKLLETRKIVTEKAPKSPDYFGGIMESMARSQDRNNRNRVAGLELEIMTTRGRKRLEKEIELLNVLQGIELQNKDLTENEKLKIEEEYRQLREQRERQHVADMVNNIAGYAQQALSVLDTFNQARANRENAELERDRRSNDRRVESLNRRLRKQAISQDEYDRQVEQIRNRQETRERAVELRQWQRNKRLSEIQAIINGAQAATKTWAELGFPLAIPGIAIVASSVAAQIDLINSQKPQFAKGGKLGGRLHSQGGNAIVDGSGQKIAEIEAGEGIINRHSMADRRRYTLSGTPSQIASSLNGLHGGIQWETPAPRFMNYREINRRYYAQGGVFGGTAQQAAATDGMMEAISRLQQTLDRGIKSYTVVSEWETAYARLTDIRNEATLK